MKQREPDNPFRTAEREALRTPEPEPDHAFWQRFAARAAARVPAAPARRARAGILLAWPPPLRQGLAAACAFLLLAGGGLFWALRPAAARAGSMIEFLSIDAAHDGIFILEDAGQQAVVVWIDERRS